MAISLSFKAVGRLALGMVCVLVPLESRAAEGSGPVEAPSRVVGVDLFKNGLAVVKRVVELPGAGAFRVESLPEPVHGTFWVEGDARVAVRLTSREVTEPEATLGAGDFQGELAGREVTVHLRGMEATAITGRVLASPVKPDEAARFGRDFEADDGSHLSGWRSHRLGGLSAMARPAPAEGRYLVIESAQGRVYVERASIAVLRVKPEAGEAPPAKRLTYRKPVLVFEVPADAGGKPMSLAVSYLSKGIGWAPSYRVRLGDGNALTLEQQALVRNEMEDLKGVAVRLISGYPSIQFGHVLSPLSPESTWSQFFSQLNSSPAEARGSMSNMIRQQAIYQGGGGGAAGGAGLEAPAGERVDLHFQDAGPLSLALGDSLLLPVATGQAAFEAIVSWEIADARDEYGRPRRRHEEPEGEQREHAWDAVRFRNPLAFPMTTAPAMIQTAQGFAGQRSVSWTAPGEQATLHITKALSVRTEHQESEEPGDRATRTLHGYTYSQARVKGELLLCNHRKRDLTLVVTRRFTGELVDAQEKPAQRLLTDEGLLLANRRTELVWTLTLKPGEERRVNYRYTVLVRH